LRHHLSFYGVLFALGTVISHVQINFVLNVASVSIEFAPDCSCIVQCTHFIHDSITLASSEYDIFSDGALTISLSQPSSVRAVSAFRMLRHPMKFVSLATLVHMDIKAFPSRSSGPLLITNSILTSLAELFSTSFRSGHRAQSCSLQFILDVASQTSQITLRQSRSAGPRIDLS
ncbi:hypothetical protein Tsp_15413, partial [Trichinella spiralis]|uniref:hypothetical protein n=1 Tax=Trichinella spiralis TaxID=6334 RepID=UPI0001EFE851